MLQRSSVFPPRFRRIAFGAWACAVLVPACGGGRTPLDPDDGPGGKRRRTDSGAPQGSNTRPTDGVPAVIHLTASTDNPGFVFLRWTIEGNLHPTSFVVLRDQQELVSVTGISNGFWDYRASPGSISAVATLTATQGTRTDAVALSWSPASTAPGPSHFYQVIAMDGQTPLVQSEPATGARAAPPLRNYEFSRDNEDA